ncbi:MAG: hypothetical protein ACLR2O_01100 [Coprococcus sp.]
MQDWERFGEEIRRTVQDAVDSQDYRKLNQTITDTINRAVNGAVNGAEQGMRSFGNAFNQATRNMGRGPGGPRGRYGQMGGADRWGRTPEEVYLRLELTGGAERMEMEEHGIRICRTIRRNHRAAAGMDTAMHSSHLSCMDRRREQRQAELS